jgi:hypothetical protein
MLHLNRRLARERRHIVQDTCNVLNMFSLQSCSEHPDSALTPTAQRNGALATTFWVIVIFGEIEGWLMS